MPAHPGQRGLRGLLHHVAELAGDRQPALAGHRGRLDEEHVAADRRPRQAGRHARLARAPARLRLEARAPEQLAHARRGHGDLALVLALGDAPRDLAADRADLALEAAHAGLARVARR